MAQAVMTEHEGSPVLVVKFVSLEEAVDLQYIVGSSISNQLTKPIWDVLYKYRKDKDDIPF